MWSSTLVAHPPQGLTRCEFRDAFLLTMFVKSAYSSCFSLPGSSDEQGVVARRPSTPRMFFFSRNPRDPVKTLLFVKFPLEGQFLK